MRNPRPVVLLVEDEPDIRRFLQTTLGAQGYRVVESATGRRGLIDAASHKPDLAVVDLGLPDMDGIEVIRGIRQWSSFPILVLSARTQESRKIEALDAGADDYIMKPCGVGELLARVRVALRHALRPSTGIRTLKFFRAMVDLERRLVTHEGQAVHLTPIEFRLLGCLARHVGMVVTHRQLLCEVWGPAHEKDTHYLRIYMKQLHEKLEEDPVRPRQLITEVGIGYRMLEGESQDGTNAPA